MRKIGRIYDSADFELVKKGSHCLHKLSNRVLPTFVGDICVRRKGCGSHAAHSLRSHVCEP